jgi:hypothetical protein
VTSSTNGISPSCIYIFTTVAKASYLIVCLEITLKA